MMTLSAGLDVGTSAVKLAICQVGNGREECLALRDERLRKRDPAEIARELFVHALGEIDLRSEDVDYVATTGEGEVVPFRTGHFYGMTAHARGALWLDPTATCVLDVGALHARAMRIDPRGRVLAYKMTSQCASGSGQFLENIARYLGITLDEIGPLSRTADRPEVVSSICAVLAETDVINMVSRGIAGPNILKGIHLSMAGRFGKLLRAAGAVGRVLVTGGLARDEGLLAAMEETFDEQELAIEVCTHPDAIHAGAIGAALWGAFRHEKLRRLELTGQSEREHRRS